MSATIRIARKIPHAHGFRIANAKRIHVLLAAPHAPFKDPRLWWQSSCGSADDAYVCIGLHSDASAPRFTMHVPRPNIIEISAYRYAPLSDRYREEHPFDTHPLAGELLAELKRTSRLDAETLAREFSIAPERAAIFKDICHYFTIAAERLADIGLGLTQASTIIAADMDALLPALVLSQRLGAPLVFDAHEIWPESGNFPRAEVDFWAAFEKRAVAPAQARFVASAPSAAWMSRAYGMDFAPLPNCEPLGSAMPPRPPRDAKRPVTFVFQGGMARTRGLHLLVGAWPHLKSDAVLVLRGPVMDEPYVAEVKRAAGDLLGDRVIFAESVTEAELVAAAAQSDIGVIPYEPIGANNMGSCPNKLSQYLAAGLPILSNDLPFVREVIEKGDCGVAVDFTDRDALVAAIDALASDPARVARMGENAERHFREDFHWEAQSRNFYEALDRLAPAAAPLTASFDYAEHVGSLERILAAAPFLRAVHTQLMRMRRALWHTLPYSLRMKLRPLARRVLSGDIYLPFRGARARSMRLLQRQWKRLPPPTRDRLKPVASRVLATPVFRDVKPARLDAEEVVSQSRRAP
ncbi:MAG: glycosyltransferase [Alphaproteobacteria bacterium]